jgi:NADH-quinone oxidoreductase subunit I
MINYLKKLILGSLNLIKGLIVTFKNLVSRAITIQYPTQKLPMSNRFRGLVDLNPQKCIMCSQCVKICPTDCIALTQEVMPENKKKLKSFQYKMELCCFCGMCAQVCPTAAIYMNKIYEIASFDRRELVINLLDPEKYAQWAYPSVR